MYSMVSCGGAIDTLAVVEHATVDGTAVLSCEACISKKTKTT